MTIIDTTKNAATNSALPPLDRSPKSNWVEDAGGLPTYIDKIARRLHANGMTIPRAIATAIATVKRWAAGGGDVHPDTRAKAARAVAEWEALKLKANAKRLAKSEAIAFIADNGDVFEVTDIGGDEIELTKAANSYAAESVKIRMLRRKMGSDPHPFKPARWASRPSGAKRCLHCGSSPDAEIHGDAVTKRALHSMRDGRFPIPNVAALQAAVTRYNALPADHDKRPAIAGHIKRRAKELGVADPLGEVTKALSATDQAAFDAETARIKTSREGPGSKPHKFKAAQWTHPNGHPRCRVCGQEQRLPDGFKGDLTKIPFEDWPVADCKGWVAKDLGPLGSWTGKDPTEDGVMVALFLHPDVAYKLALEGGESPDQLHITLAFLGKVDEQTVDRNTVARVVSSVASRFDFLTGRYNGLGRFEADDRGVGWPLVALPDVPGLSTFREALVAALTDVGVNVYDNHGFTAHTTLGYVTPADEGDAARILSDGFDGIDVSFGTVCLAWGPDRFEAPFGYAAMNATVVKAGPMVESDPAKHYTLGPWYPAAPTDVTAADLDAHGEFVTAPDVQEMVWDYVRAGDRDLRLQHTDGTKIGEWVELLCIPAPMTVPLTLPTGETVTKTFAAGTPFMGAVWNDLGWNLVERGEIRGFSFGGSAEKMAVEVGA